MVSFRFRRAGGDETGPAADRPISSRAGGTKMRPGCLAAFFAVFLLVGLGFLTFFAVPAWRVIEARWWMELPCHILESGVGRHSGSDGDTYSVDVLYTYTVEGVEYRSERYQFLGGSSSGYEGKAEVVARYPPGSETTCWVDPEDPSQAVLHRGLSWEYLFALIPLVFVAVGAGGMIFSLGGWIVRRRSRTVDWLPAAPEPAMEEAVGGEAASFSRGPAFGLPQSGGGPLTFEARYGPWLKFVGVLLLAVFWNGIISVFVWQAVEGWRSGGGGDTGCLTLFLVPFVLVGLVLLMGVPYQLLALFNPRIRLSISAGSIPLGDRAQLSWRFSGAAGRISRLRIELVGREEATYRRGTDTRTDKEIFARLPVTDTTHAVEIAAGSAVLAVPDGTMHSFEAPNNKIRWTLEVAGEIRRWPDVAEVFDLVIEPHGKPGRTEW